MLAHGRKHCYQSFILLLFRVNVEDHTLFLGVVLASQVYIFNVVKMLPYQVLSGVCMCWIFKVLKCYSTSRVFYVCMIALWLYL